MRNVTVRKTVKSSGDSLTINATRELRQLGLDKGDEVMVTFGPSGPDDEHIRHLAILVADPRNFYRNSRWLQAGDLNENGDPISDKTSYLNPADMAETMDRLDAWRFLIEGGFIMTRALLPRDCAYYSDKLGSFVLNFDPESIERDIVGEHHRKRYVMDYISRMLEDPSFSELGLSSLSDLRLAVKDVQNDLRFMEDDRLVGPLSEETVDPKVEELNRERAAMLAERHSPKAWYFTIDCARDENGTYRQIPVFRLFSDSAFIADARSNLKSHISEQTDGLTHDPILFGPFREESEAMELIGFFKTASKLGSFIVDERSIRKLRRISESLCITGYLERLDGSIIDYCEVDRRCHRTPPYRRIRRSRLSRP